MYYSDNFKETNIIIGDKQYRMQYDIANAIPNSVRAFGNIYINPEEPMEFVFFTLNNKIAGYTPMNGTKEFIGNIVSTILGYPLPFEE